MKSSQTHNELRDILQGMLQSQQRLAELIENLSHLETNDMWLDPSSQDDDKETWSFPHRHGRRSTLHNGYDSPECKPELPCPCSYCERARPRTVGCWIDMPFWEEPPYRRPVRRIRFIQEE